MLNASPGDYMLGASAGAAAIAYITKTVLEIRNHKRNGFTLGEQGVDFLQTWEAYIQVQTRALQSIEKSLATLTDLASRTCSTQILHTDGKTR